MFRRVLPSYTSERYFLLSEIEEHGTIVSLDSPDTHIPSDLKICIIYSLWKYSDGLEELISKLGALYRKCGGLSPVLVIETYMSPISAEKEERLSSFVEGLKQRYSQWRDSIVIFALADSMHATPGLEFIYDTCTELILTSSRDVTVVAEHADVFLGYDHSLEPDAFSGVTQVQLSTVDAPIQTAARARAMQVRPPPKTLLKSEARAVSHVVIALIVILGVILGYYTKFVRY